MATPTPSNASTQERKTWKQIRQEQPDAYWPLVVGLSLGLVAMLAMPARNLLLGIPKADWNFEITDVLVLGVAGFLVLFAVSSSILHKVRDLQARVKTLEGGA